MRQVQSLAAFLSSYEQTPFLSSIQQSKIPLLWASAYPLHYWRTLNLYPFMTNDKFKTKNGDLTPYALACGYVQEKESNGIQIKLWHEGGPLYHVMAFDFSQGKRLFWESFERLTDARAFYKKPPLL